MSFVDLLYFLFIISLYYLFCFLFLLVFIHRFFFYYHSSIYDTVLLIYYFITFLIMLFISVHFYSIVSFFRPKIFKKYTLDNRRNYVLLSIHLQKILQARNHDVKSMKLKCIKNAKCVKCLKYYWIIDISVILELKLR